MAITENAAHGPRVKAGTVWIEDMSTYALQEHTAVSYDAVCPR